MSTFDFPTGASAMCCVFVARIALHSMKSTATVRFELTSIMMERVNSFFLLFADYVPRRSQAEQKSHESQSFLSLSFHKFQSCQPMSAHKKFFVLLF